VTPEILAALTEARREKRPVVLATRLSDGAQHLLPGPGAGAALNEAAEAALRDDQSRTVQADGAAWFLQAHNPPLRLVVVGAALSPGGAGSAFGAQPARLGAGTAQASGLLAVQRPGKAVGQEVLAACGGILVWGLVVVGSVRGHGVLLSVSARSDSMF